MLSSRGRFASSLRLSRELGRLLRCLDEAERDQLAGEFTAALELLPAQAGDQLRSEIVALQELLSRARRVRDQAGDSKLSALRECLTRPEFFEPRIDANERELGLPFSSRAGESPGSQPAEASGSSASARRAASSFVSIRVHSRLKLLIFTEHRDTLKHLRQHLEKWGYTVTEIHGGKNFVLRPKTGKHPLL